MEDFLATIQQNAEQAPYIIFGLLLLAGFNVPVSEDLMIFTSALLATGRPDLKYQLFIGVYLGAYFSDLIAYWLGRLLGPKLFEIRLFKSMVSLEKLERVSKFYEKYGVITLMLGRFIPFGVRNALFITAGFGKMSFTKFSISDLIACTISTVIFFSLYFTYGKTVIEYVKKGNIILFSVALVVIIVVWWRKKKSSPQSGTIPQ